MKIAIDGSRAFIKKRTGIEEYSYQTIKHLREWLKNENVYLYIRHNQSVDFEVPNNWQVKKLWFPRFWTQVRLSLEMLFRSIDALFIPAHTVPIFHPKNTTVVIHGLEFEFCPQAYSWLEKVYMRFVIKKSCKWAKNVVCVSENTKKDVMKLYGVPENKIRVVYEGYVASEFLHGEISYSGIKNEKIKNIFQNNQKYILFIGRIEKRKNIINIIKSFEFLKSKYGISQKLVLAGRPGYGYDDISKHISKSIYKEDIFELGYISNDEKWGLLKKAEVFIFPSFYEGFGLPILEAQKMMIPVVTSKISSIPEVAGGAALYSSPDDFELIAENTYILLQNEKAREDLIKRGLENIRRFGWVDCAKSIAEIIRNK